MRRWKKKLHPKLRAQIVRAESLGCNLERTPGGHVGIRSPSGRMLMSLAWSPSDHRGARNGASDLRKTLDLVFGDIENPEN